MKASPKVRALIGSLIAGLVCAGVPASAQDGTVFDRPGAAPAQAANTGDGDLAALQLSGVSSLGGQRMFNFVDSRNNKSFWVPLNGSTDGFSVTAYDENNVAVTVTRGGQSRQVQLRQVQIAAPPAASAHPVTVQVPPRPAGSPAPAVIRTADGGEIVNPKTPQEIAQAEMEARMMVSDLLEISMQERARQKALREAQQKQQQQPGAGTTAAAVPAATHH